MRERKRGGGGERRRENLTAEYRCERKRGGGGRITDVNGIVNVSEGGHIQGGESLCLCLLGRAACILMWHASKVSLRCRF